MILAATLVCVLGSTLVAGDVDLRRFCGDETGECADVPCPCEGACADDSGCPTGYVCRPDWSADDYCYCVVTPEGDNYWGGVTTQSLNRCGPAGIPTGPRGYTIIDLDTAFAPMWLVPSGFNNRGQLLVGYQSEMFLLQNDTLTHLASVPPNALNADINDHEQIVFAHRDYEGMSGVFLIDSLDAKPVRVSTSIPNRQLQINNEGQVLI